MQFNLRPVFSLSFCGVIYFPHVFLFTCLLFAGDFSASAEVLSVHGELLVAAFSIIQTPHFAIQTYNKVMAGGRHDAWGIIQVTVNH